MTGPAASTTARTNTSDTLFGARTSPELSGTVPTIDMQTSVPPLWSTRSELSLHPTAVSLTLGAYSLECAVNGYCPTSTIHPCSASP